MEAKHKESTTYIMFNKQKEGTYQLFLYNPGFQKMQQLNQMDQEAQQKNSRERNR